MGDLDGRVAVITGAASGIGRATAERFVEEGARVVIADIDDETGGEVARALGEAAIYVRADVTEEAEIEAALAQAMITFDRLDVVFNNAGFSGVGGGIEVISTDGYDHTMSVLLRGVFLSIKHAAKVMKRQGSGSIISNASIAGISTAISAPHIYKVAKAGVVHLTRSVAVELGPSGVRVNCVCPGYIPTPIFAHDRGMAGAKAEETVARIAPLFDDLQPIKRAGRARDIAEAVLWLASDKASFVTGHALVVDGGVTAGIDWQPNSALAQSLQEAVEGRA